MSKYTDKDSDLRLLKLSELRQTDKTLVPESKRNLRYLDKLEWKANTSRDFGVKVNTEVKREEITKMLKVFSNKFKKQKDLKKDKEYYIALNSAPKITEKPKVKKAIKISREKQNSGMDTSTYAQSLQDLSDSIVNVSITKQYKNESMDRLSKFEKYDKETQRSERNHYEKNILRDIEKPVLNI